ncbi:MAG TPA: TonB family protein [Steroidobacteraceae bacterium]|nr:TonB family protein [Steroidobacteraceae bacterium]
MRVLLVDHDSEALENISRAIRGVLELDCVTSKGDALLLLRQNTYDVLIACERCVDGSGLDLLARTTRTTVPLKRVFAAATERLQLLGPRLAPFKVQRTISYPIDLEELWLAIAQVTSGPNDETDGTIERVVLDERGIPSTGSVPRAPIPPRPPAPLSEVSAATSPIMASGAGRTATARLAQPAPEPPLRPPPPPRQPPQVARTPAPPKTTSDTGRMRALNVPAPPRSTSDTGRMRVLNQPMPPMSPAGPEEFPPWTPELPAQDDFAEVAAQARFGVRQKAADEAARRKRTRLIAAGGIAAAVAGVIVLLIEQFYDPAARAREQAISREIDRMAEEQKVSDSLARIEIEIENAIMANDLVKARRDLADLVEKSPNHPRLDFLRDAINRAEALAKLSPESKEPVHAEMPATGERSQAKPRVERTPDRTPDRPATRSADRNTSPPRSSGSGTPPTRAYGAPIGESPQQTLPLNAPINSPPVSTVRRGDNSFAGRTIEASDSAVGRSPPPPAAPATPAPTAISQPTSNAAGSAVVATPNAAPAAAPAPPPPVDVVPAKIVKRVTPIAPANIPAKTQGYVVVQFNIGVNGRVNNLSVIESEPQGVFDDAAQAAVRKWVYEPRKENGVAVESTAKARLVFEPAK